MAVLKYSLIRLATFFLLFAACLLMGLGMIMGLIVGLIGSWAVGYLFFNRLRLEAGAQLARKVDSNSRRTSASEASDNEAEDALAEEYHQPGSEDSPPSPPPLNSR